MCAPFEWTVLIDGVDFGACSDQLTLETESGRRERVAYLISVGYTSLGYNRNLISVETLGAYGGTLKVQYLRTPSAPVTDAELSDPERAPAREGH